MTPVRIGSTRFDASTLRLERGGEQLRLQAQPARLLALLASRSGSIVRRDEIGAHLWRDTAVAYDQGINYCIRQIRIALGPDAHLVETLPREGYRLVTTAPLRRPDTATRLRVRRWVAAAAVIASVFAAGFGVGAAARETEVGNFVYVHLVHPDRCPYVRLLIAPHHNS